MKLTRQIPILLILLAASCTLGGETPSPSPPPPTATRTPTQTPSPTRTFTPLPLTLTPSLTETPTPNIIHPEVVKLCPEQREVPFEELGMDPNIGMMVRIDPRRPYEHLGIISGGDPNPVISPVDPFTYDVLEVSPDGQWIAFLSVETLEITVWISSIDGAQKWEAAKISGDLPHAPGVRISWLSNEEMLILAKLWEREDYSPYLLVNLSTSEQMPLSPIPDEALHIRTFTVDQRLYSIYIYPTYGEPRFILLDHETNNERIILPWIFEDYPQDYYLTSSYVAAGIALKIDDTGKVTFAIEQPYGFDISKDLDIDALANDLNYDQAMSQVVVGETFDWTRNMEQHNNSSSLSFFRANQAISPYIDENTPYYVYDWENNILRDYCLAGDYVFRLNFPSLDGRYLTWTENSGYGDDYDYKLVIMDLTTGYVSRISGVEFLGWFDASEE